MEQINLDLPLPPLPTKCAATLHSNVEYGKWIAAIQRCGFLLSCAYPRFERWVLPQPFAWIQIFFIVEGKEWFVCGEGPSGGMLDELFGNL